MFREITIAELILKTLSKTFLYRECIILRSLFLGIIKV